MKGIFKNKAQKAFLTAAISLALTGSVFAMPVLDKNQTPTTVTVGDLTSKTGTIDVTGLGLVDWQSFNIANGETLKFILNGDNANIINRVTGTDMSQIYGHMLSQGEGGVCLVNPNGILIGNGARIDVSSLVLSTATFNDNDPNKILNAFNNNGKLTLQADASKSIKIEGQSAINFYDTLCMIGGKIQIADNVTISNGLKRPTVDGQHTIDGDGTNGSELDIYAIDKGTLNLKDGSLVNVSAQAGNGLEIGKADITLKNPGGVDFNYTNGHNPALSVSMGAHDITFNGTQVKLLTNKEEEASHLKLYALNSYQDKGATQECTADASNSLYLNGADMQANDLEFAAGKVDIENSTLTKKQEDCGLSVVAGTKATLFQDGDGLNLTTAPTSTVTLKDSKLDAVHGITIVGGQVAIENADSKYGLFTHGSNKNDPDNESIDILATQHITDPDHYEATPENSITVKGGSLDSAWRVNLRAGKIALNDVAKVNAAGRVRFMAVKAESYDEAKDGTYDEKLTLTPENTIAIQNSHITADKGIRAFGGQIDIQGSTLQNQ